MALGHSAITEEPLPKVPVWSEAPAAASFEQGRVGLWLHPEDLAVERGELAGLRFESINASWPAGIATAAVWSPKVAEWTRAALGDGASRASKHFGTEVVATESSNLAAAMVEWAQARKLSAVIAYRPFVGPWLPEAHAIEAALTKAGITMRWRRRAWDTTLFPHATRGYFPFWERIRSAG